MGIGEILDATIHITRARFKDLVILVAVVAVPAQMLQFLVSLSVPESSVASTGFDTTDLGTGAQSAPDTDVFLLQMAALLLTIVIGLATSWLATAACTEIVSATYLGGTSSWRDSLGVAWSRLGALVGANLTIFVVAGLALLACIAPGVWLFVMWAVAVPAIIIERIGGLQGMRRSFHLVKGRWWTIFAIVALGQIIAGVVQSVVVLPLLPVLLIGDVGIVGPLVAVAIGNVVGVVLTYPFLAALTVIIYYDLRIRKEGFDVALMLRDLDDPESVWNRAEDADPYGVGGFALPPPTGPPADRPPPEGWTRPPPGWDRE